MVRTIFAIIGVLLLFAIPIPWLLGTMVVLGAGSGEHKSIEYTGMVTCPEVLRWTDWKVGTGPLSRSHIYDQIDKDAEIIEHRIGRDEKYFGELTFYQAKYRSPDGSITIAPADGPKPIVSVNESKATWYSVAFAGLGIGFLVLSSLLRTTLAGKIQEAA